MKAAAIPVWMTAILCCCTSRQAKQKSVSVGEVVAE